MFKALGRVRKNKAVFEVEVKPLEIDIYTNQAFTFKMQVRRGKQGALETK